MKKGVKHVNPLFWLVIFMALSLTHAHSLLWAFVLAMFYLDRIGACDAGRR